MNDIQLAIDIRAALLAGLTDIGITGLEVLANYQPTAQGKESGPAIYFFKVGDSPSGWQYRGPVKVSGVTKMAELRNIDTTFQFMARVAQDPTDLTARTAGDVLNIAAMILQASSTKRVLQSKGIGGLVIGELRNPYFVNSSDRFEASPSFDFTVTHRRSIMKTTNVIEEVNGVTIPK